MSDARSSDDENGDIAGAIGRRGFIGAGLAGAGAALIAPAASRGDAGASSAPSVAAAAPAPPSSTAATGPIARLPLQSTYPHLPAIPIDAGAVPDTLARLTLRTEQAAQAKKSLTNTFRIGGRTDVGYAFLYGASAPALERDDAQALTSLTPGDPAKAGDLIEKAIRRGRPAQGPASNGAVGRALERPEQFSMAWTTFPNVYESAAASLPDWASSLRDADSASAQFWPMIANHGVGYNLIFPEKLTRQSGARVKRQFGAVWNRKLGAALASGRLFVIDMSRFEALQPSTVAGAPRFTPSTVTLLIRDPRTKSLTPVAISVSGYRGRGRRLYTRENSTDGAWLYALQAAKTSITVFGVWLGHVYPWHIVTCAMQMTMFNTLGSSHPVYRLLAPHSKYAIPFDNVLLLAWSKLAPPTSLATPAEFLQLANDYAANRSFFDDNPNATLRRLHLRQADFTRSTAWDRHPVVARLLQVWDLVAEYVHLFVAATYRSDATVAADTSLQRWIAMSTAPSQGNVRGLPRMNSRAALERVLTSLLYRITVHGISRMNSTANPALTFVANFPHCLQRTDIPAPRTRISTKRLLTYLPNTETIGEAMNFYFIFVFSPPYEPFIPLTGVNSNLFFPGGGSDRRNRALIRFRRGLAAFINAYEPRTPQRFQWPRNIET